MADLSNVRLVLLLTRGMSLKRWDEVGMLEREVVPYRLLHHVSGERC